MFIPNFRSIELLELKIHGWDNFIPPQVWGALKSPGQIGLKKSYLKSNIPFDVFILKAFLSASV